MQITVLVVEDDFLIAEDYRTTIEDHGWMVLGPAATANQGLTLLIGATPTVAILDLMLLRSISTSIAEELSRQSIPFIVATGVDDVVTVGGEVFRDIVNIGKPVKPAIIISALEEIVGRAIAKNGPSPHLDQ